MSKSLFQTIFLVILGFITTAAVLIFAGILPGFRTQKIGVAGDLTVWSGFALPEYRQVMDVLGGENKDKFTITYTDQGRDLENNLINALASGKGPDVIIAPHELLLKHQDKLAIIPFSSLSLRSYQDTFIDEALLFVNQEGLIALPVAVDPLLLFYNKDLYKNASLIEAPANWEKFIEIQPQLTKVAERGRLVQSAAALGTFNNNINAKDILSLFILQAGGSPALLSDGKINITLSSNFGFVLSPAEAALSFFLQFADPLKSTYCWNRSLPEAQDTFLAENLANYFGFASEIPYLREKNPHLNFDLSLVPQMEGKNRLTFGRLYGVAVLKSSRKIGPAWQMAFALAGEESSKQGVSLLNLAPVRRSLLVPDPAQADQKVIFDAALVSRGWYDFAPAETKNIFQSMVDGVSSGRFKVDGALKQASDQMASLLKQL